ncbi:iki3 family protein [Zalerion maritima]|uniref:Elongator complex protein 1 n=1 Tax=Zalerion maritima TaxID=339359 RepID=A0AAD5RVR6_9PEZI|nr:iki3 family protein [Zalerion maritima]
MKNLRNIRFNSWKPPKVVAASCWDAAKDDIVCACGPSPDSNEIRLLRLSESLDGTIQHREISSWDAPSPTPDIAVDRILSIHHFGDTLTTCLVLEGGDIYIVREEGDLGGLTDPDLPLPVHIEIVGSIDAGITAARWSPDEELLAITTKAHTVVFMSRSFDGIADFSMTAEDLEASKHVSVGWGKKETQFRGKGAKAMRDPTIPEKVDEGVLSASDDGRTTISWRGDGAYVAINAVHNGKRRVIRVYSREGALDGVGEPVDGLESSLSWRPAGNLMAGIQRLPDRTDVVFFERNGLRHGQFTLRPAPQPKLHPSVTLRLEWNSDSTVLAVIYPGTVQLYTMGNYHWYLKQEVTPQASETFCWHPEKPLWFQTAGEGDLSWFEYVFSVSRGSTSLYSDYGAVAVVDGTTLKVTPFRTANVPPPMSMFDLEAPGPIRDVVFTSNNEHFAVFYEGAVDIYEWQKKGARSIRPKRVLHNCIPDIPGEPDNPPVLAAALGLDIHQGILVSMQSSKQGIKLVAIDVDTKDGVIKLNASQDFPGGQLLLASGNRPYALGDKMRTISPTADGKMEVISPSLFPAFVGWAETQVLFKDSVVFTGLTRNGILYTNGKVLAKNCTSFVLTSSHVIFTTNNHLVKFVHLAQREDGEYQAPLDDPENDERCRSIERGARLVTAMPSSMSIVLQMPRGNLETIYPRAMVLAGIRQAIQQKEYRSAFLHCRTHRVDMNILYDNRPSQFLKNVDLFLDQLEDPTSIDLFLSSLREEDVTETMYKDTAPPITPLSEKQGGEETGSKPSDKVNAICGAVLKSLEARHTNNLQNIITAHVCKTPPALDDGLLVVAKLMEEDDQLAETAAEHICFLVDVNRLYDHALGLYNLDLALLIAQQSQRDPREYVPFVQSLHELPELRGKYTIDNHLGRREKALGFLHAMDTFDELKAYTVKHSLYSQALALYRYNKLRHQEIILLYAEYLEATSKFHDAGLSYESLGKYAKASSCYRAAGSSSWRECIHASQRQSSPISDAALSDLATAICDALTEAKDHASAAEVAVDYLSSPDQAIKSYCKGYHFSQALQLCARLRQSQPQLLDTVDQGLAEATGSSTEFLADCKSQLAAQVPRVLELRERAKNDPLAFYEGEIPGGGDIPDDISIAASSRVSTSASLFTRYTGKQGSIGTVGTGVSRATAKNRKREEKKRARGRKGTVYEEEYLVNSIRRLVERMEGSARVEVGRLVEALVRRDMGERARAVEALMGEVVDGCRKAVGEIWGPKEVEKTEQAENQDEEGHGPRGGDAVLAEMLEDRMKKQTPPTIKEFERLSLLG